MSAVGSAPAVSISLPLQQVICILLVAAAVKAPLGIPLYLNALLLLVGLFSILAVQSLQPVLVWPLAMLALGAFWASVIGTLPTSGPRLVQVALIVFAIGLLARSSPALFARYLALLLPLALLMLALEPLLPESLYAPRTVFGYSIPRLGGLHGEHNYNSMMLGVVGVILAQHPPRVLGLLAFMIALTAVSRGFLVALLAWFGAKAIGRWLSWIGPLVVLALCSQPLVVLGVDTMIDEATRIQLHRLSSSRYATWVAYANMGLSAPLGVGYWEGPAAIAQFATFFKTAHPHSIFLQVFGEFGWFGYLLFVGFILHVTWLTVRAASAQMPVLLFILTGYASYAGLSDWAFWVAIGYVLACVRLASVPAGQHDELTVRDAAAAGDR